MTETLPPPPSTGPLGTLEAHMGATDFVSPTGTPPVLVSHTEDIKPDIDYGPLQPIIPANTTP